MSTICMQVSMEPEESVRSPGTGVGGWELPYGVLGIKPWFSTKQYLFIASELSSFHSPSYELF